VKPLAGTDSCEVSHLGYVVSGRMKVTMDHGSEGEAGPGDVVALPPGHDAEVVGGETCVLLDFGEIDEYAQARLTLRQAAPSRFLPVAPRVMATSHVPSS
jgi:hypothetical protein